MIPLRSQSRLRVTPWATWAVIAVCVAAMARLVYLDEERAARLMFALAVVPARLVADPIEQSLTVVTSLFLHAGWVHLVGNMLFLAVFGPAVEARLGRLWFLTLYVAGGSLAALAFVWAHPTSVTPLVGASGAIAAVLGAHLVLEPRTRVTTLIPAVVIFEIASLPAAFVIALWFVLQVASTVAPVGADTGGVAWLAHIAGFVFGAAAVLPLVMRDRATAFKRERARGTRRTRRR